MLNQFIRKLLALGLIEDAFCELAEVKLPKGYKPDGVSQVETLKGKGSALREKPLFWKIGAPWPARSVKPDHWVSYAVVKDQWKLLTNAKGNHLELFDLVDDPYEKTDLKEQLLAVAPASGGTTNGQPPLGPDPR